MKFNRYSSAIWALVLGCLLALGPKYLFTLCEDQNMRCQKTQDPLFIMGALLMVLGLSLLFDKSYYSAFGACLGIILCLTFCLVIGDIYGICLEETMKCQSMTIPTIRVISMVGILVFVNKLFSLFDFIKRIEAFKKELAQKKNDQNRIS
jgi:hypothetical protein